MKIPINPTLPAHFDGTRNEDRPASHQKWWYRPYIVTFDRWSRGTRYDVYCLDGGAWDRPTWLGDFADLPAAIAFAQDYAETLASMGMKPGKAVLT